MLLNLSEQAKTGGRPPAAEHARTRACGDWHAADAPFCHHVAILAPRRRRLLPCMPEPADRPMSTPPSHCGRHRTHYHASSLRRRTSARSQKRLASALHHLVGGNAADDAAAVLRRHWQSFDPSSHFPLDGANMPCPSRTTAELAKGIQLSAPPKLRETTSVTFAVVGDFGTGLAHPHQTRPDARSGDPVGYLLVAQMVCSWNPEFVLTTGDNNYSVGAKATVDAHMARATTCS